MTRPPHLKLVEQLSCAILLLDEDRIIHYANPAAEDLLGQSCRQLASVHLDTLLVHSKIDCEWLQKQLRQHNSIRISELELVIPPRNHWVDLNAQRLLDSETLPILIELHLVERQLHQQLAEERHHQAQRQLLRNLAHEIKNPLGGIKGAAQLLARQLTEPHWERYTQMLLSQTERLSQLLDRMLGPQKPEVQQKVNLHQLLEDILALLALDTPCEIQFIRDYDPSLPDLFVANAALQQAILNILLNARQALYDAGNITLRTRAVSHPILAGKQQKQGVALSIIDDGPGIPEAIRPHLFVPMITGRAHGTGLGLAITQELIARHNGHIEWHSEPGHTVFTLFIPYGGSHD